MNAQNTLDQRLTKIQMKYFERHADIQQKKYERARNRIIGNAQKHLAYKLVLKQHRIAKAKDYKKALDGNYSFHALHYEVNDMVQFIRPDLVRERRARALINENRKQYESLLKKNAETCAIIFPMKKTWEAFDFSKIKTRGDNDDDDAKSQSGESVVSPLPKLDLRKGQLRRRIIEEPSSKPGSSKPVSPAKRQGITMNMMKKQKSFIENQEKVTQIQDEAVQNAAGENNSSEVNEDETQISNTDNQMDKKDKTDDDKSDKKTLILPPLETKRGAPKFMKPKGTGINSKLRSLSLHPKMSGVGMNPKIKLPALKMKKAPVLSETAVDS